jgi:hypothetical protein
VWIPSVVVDRLPSRLWKPGNLHFGARLHFCVGAATNEDHRVVRVVELNGDRIGQGTKPRMA